MVTPPELLPCSFCRCKSDLFANVNAPEFLIKQLLFPQPQIGSPSSQHKQPLSLTHSLSFSKGTYPLLLSVLVIGAHILSTESGVNTGRPETVEGKNTVTGNPLELDRPIFQSQLTTYKLCDLRQVLGFSELSSHIKIENTLGLLLRFTLSRLTCYVYLSIHLAN